MPNLVFHLEVLDKVINQLSAQGDPRGPLMKGNLKFTALGALGPDLLRYLPISTALGDALVKLTQATPVGQISSLPPPLLQELFLNPTGAIYTLLFRQVVVPNWPTINEINAFFDKLDAIVAAQNELAIPGIIGEALDVLKKAKALKSTLPQAVPSVAAVVGQIIALPPGCSKLSDSPFRPPIRAPIGSPNSCAGTRPAHSPATCCTPPQTTGSKLSPSVGSAMSPVRSRASPS
jgi:hypothetical protein